MHKSYHPYILNYSIKYFLTLIVMSTGYAFPFILHLFYKRLGIKKCLFSFLPVFILATVVYLLGSYWYYYTRLHLFDPFLQEHPSLIKKINASKNKNDFRILALGGSTTKNGRLPIESRYPAILQNILQKRYPNMNIEVFNGGTEWYTTKHSLINYNTYYYDWHPDLVIIMHAINDLVRSFSPKKYAISPYNDRWSHFYGPAIEGATPSTFEKFLLGKFVDTWYSNLRVKRVDFALGKYLSINAFEKNMRRLVNNIRTDGARVIIVTQPFLYKQNMSLNEQNNLWFDKTYFVSNNSYLHSEFADYKSLFRAMNAYNDIVRKVSTSENVILVDAEKKVEKTLENFRDDVHYKIPGARKLATYIAETVIKSDIVHVKHSIKNFR